MFVFNVKVYKIHNQSWQIKATSTQAGGRLMAFYFLQRNIAFPLPSSCCLREAGNAKVKFVGKKENAKSERLRID